MLIAHKVLQGWLPVLDVFASSTTTKVEGSFFSEYLCPGSLGVNAWDQSWTRHAKDGTAMIATLL